VSSLGFLGPQAVKALTISTPIAIEKIVFFMLKRGFVVEMKWAKVTIIEKCGPGQWLNIS
jgi:hypothetical protein